MVAGCLWFDKRVYMIFDICKCVQLMGIIRAVKIYIIGPSASGKSTLALEISKKYNVKYYDLDLSFLDLKKISGSKQYWLDQKVIKSNIAKITKDKSWVAEGVYPVDELLTQADVVVYLHQGLLKSLVLFWKRSLSDPEHRKRFPLSCDIAFSWTIIKQHFGQFYSFFYDDLEYLTTFGFEDYISKRTKPFKFKVNGFDYKDLFACLNEL